MSIHLKTHVEYKSKVYVQEILGRKLCVKTASVVQMLTSLLESNPEGDLGEVWTEI